MSSLAFLKFSSGCIVNLVAWLSYVHFEIIWVKTLRPELDCCHFADKFSDALIWIEAIAFEFYWNVFQSMIEN